jgi:hypothetical protein
MIASDLKKENEKRKGYDQLKKQINNKYCELMTIDKQKFELKEIDSSKFENIKNVFIAGGSNKPLATIIWYINLLKIKQLFNPDAIKLPVDIR